MDEIGVAVFDAWFREVKFTPGMPNLLEVQKPFQRGWIAGHFSEQLKRCYGECEIRLVA